VGPGQFRRVDTPPGSDITDDIPSAYRHLVEEENAHNYYLQLAAEFGLPALFAFLLWLASVSTRAVRQGILGEEDDALARLRSGLAAGLGGVAALCLAGHPLLLPEIQATFWTAAALASVDLSARRAPQTAG
jgi:O-antigen ligase